MSSRSSARPKEERVEEDHKMEDRCRIPAADAPPTEFDSVDPSEFIDSPVPATDSQPPVKNAFSLLLSSSKAKDAPYKRPRSSSSSSSSKPDSTRRTHPHHWRNCLEPYLAKPTEYPPTVVLRHTPSFVTIFDAYPKSTIHLLLLPRDKKINTLDPIEAFNTHPELLLQAREEIENLKPLLQKEMRRRYGNQSKTQRAHDDYADTDEPTSPPRVYDLKIGIHAHPSLNHLHVHILTPDMVNSCLKHKKHYNSFSTGFFVPLDDFPMAEDDYRRTHPGRDEKSGEVYLKADMKCWRCGKNFGGKFKQLKQHLTEERAEWLAE